MKALNKGNILGVRKYQEGGSAPISQMTSRPVQQIEMPTRNQGLVAPVGGGYKPQSLEDLPTSQIWEQVTATPWSEAHHRGHTDGSREGNMDLRQILVSENPTGLLDHIEKESDKALKQEETANIVPSPAPAQVKTLEGNYSPRIIAKPSNSGLIQRNVPDTSANQVQEVTTNPADTTTLPERNPSAYLKMGPATGGGTNWSGIGLIGGGGLAIAGAAFHKPIGKMITARYQRMKAAKVAKATPAVETPPATVAETPGTAVTETAPVVAAKEPVVAPAETAPVTTPTEVVKPATKPSTVSKSSGNVRKAPGTVNVKEAKLAPRPGTTVPKEAPAYFEGNNTSGVTSMQKIAESAGKPQAVPVPAPKAAVETSIKNRNRTTKPKATNEKVATSPKEVNTNIKGKNSQKETTFQETAQEVVKPKEATAPEATVQASIKNRSIKTGAAPKETQPSLFDEVGKVAETIGEGVGKAAETAKVVGKSGTLKGIGKVAGRANMFGMILDPALQIVRAFHYKYSSPKDYDGHYGAGAWDADHKATEEENRRIRSTNPVDHALPGEGMDRRMEMNRNGGKLNSLSGNRLLIQK